MGLGETQVFQDEKSRLANTTVARIVAAKGSLGVGPGGQFVVPLPAPPPPRGPLSPYMAPGHGG